jgi:hypothetical protein
MEAQAICILQSSGAETCKCPVLQNDLLTKGAFSPTNGASNLIFESLFAYNLGSAGMDDLFFPASKGISKGFAGAIEAECKGMQN